MSVILGKCYCRVNRSFTGCNRHRRRVAHNNCSLHKRTPCFRVCKLRELCQRFNDLACTFAAGSNNNNINICIFRCSVLQNSFACAKRTRSTVRSALCNWEEGVNKTYFCFHCFGRRQSFAVALNCTLNRPLERHRNRDFPASLIS